MKGLTCLILVGIIWLLFLTYKDYKKFTSNIISSDGHKLIPTKEELRRAMKYHGILYCFEEGGEWYFIRDNKKCRVFGPAYKRYINYVKTRRSQTKHFRTAHNRPSGTN